MHEYSLAYGIVMSILDLIKEKKLRRVREIEIEVNELAQIDLEIFKTALNELSKDTPLEDARFIIREVPTTFKCHSCNYEWSWRDVESDVMRELCGDESECDNPIHLSPSLASAYVRCPKCGSLDIEFTSYGVRVSRVVGEVSD
ncbi:MAG: hypothetical protein B6V02_02705 [Thermoprotei archaeon ex4572_64]|nr:MAG: hypothetical protein B6V02_02705 [Thermoprotei archaeon ex4572_64]